jgi:hypothetical protein
MASSLMPRRPDTAMPENSQMGGTAQCTKRAVVNYLIEPYLFLDGCGILLVTGGCSRLAEGTPGNTLLRMTSK